VQTLPLQFVPGTQFVYTQTNYVVMGKIIAKLTGEPFASFVQQRQFDVVGMKETSYGDSTDVTPHVASLYTYLRLLTTGTQTTGVEKSDILHTRYEALPEYLHPAAGIQTTSTELANWLIALEDGKLINKSSLDQLWTPQALKDGTYGGFSDEINGYALGWPVMRRTPHRAITPVGGERSTMFIYPDDDLKIIVLTNLMGASPQSFVDKIASLYISQVGNPLVP
jgi:CubicO group peptidase (beta-lactamase class C family)